MLAKYLELAMERAMERAVYEVIEDEGTYYGEISANRHEGDIGVGLLSRLLRQAGISREEWLED